MPPSITARIIVKRNEEISDEKLLWRKGAVLKYKGRGETIARIIEESQSITVSVKGTEKTAYIASLRETIKAIFEDYKVIKPDLLYEVLIPVKSEDSKLSSLLEKEKPLMLSEEVIRGHSQEDIPYFDALNRRIIPLGETGRAYNIIININGNGNNVLFESPDTVINQSLPATVTEEQYKHILQMLEKFLESEQAGKLTDSEFRTAQTELAKARKEGCEKGWERILSIAANIATIGSAILPFFV